MYNDDMEQTFTWWHVHSIYASLTVMHEPDEIYDVKYLGV